MYRRTKVRIYLRSGAVVKVRTKTFSVEANRITNERTTAQWSWRWWNNRRLFDLKIEDISAIVVSRW